MGSEIKTINEPTEPLIEITSVHEPEIVFVEDWQRRKWPSARVFSDLGEAEGTLIAMSAAMPQDELADAVQDAIDAVQQAKHVAADMRDDAYDADLGRSNLLMGDLEQLPEVGLSNEPNRRYMTCPWCREEENTYEDADHRLHCFECGGSFDPIEIRTLQERADGNEMIWEAPADG